MKETIRKTIVMMAGIVSVPCAISHAGHRLPKPECKATDPRFQLLKNYFHRTRSPIEHLSSVFIQEADDNHLDWRLLPGLATVESSAGVSSRGNNVFGWGNGGRSFRSVRAGIHFVAERLANSPFYRNKSLRQKLYAYNPTEGYCEKVESAMARISSPKLAYRSFRIGATPVTE